jgi:hypothetical protein
MRVVSQGIGVRRYHAKEKQLNVFQFLGSFPSLKRSSWTLTVNQNLFVGE